MFPRAERLTVAHDTTRFCCGTPSLDDYLHERALLELSQHIAVVYVVCLEPGVVAGFHTLSACSVEAKLVGADPLGEPPPYRQVPATLLGRLAVDRRLQGHGLGDHLLRDALLTAEEASQLVGSQGVVVDARPEALGFYERVGFRPLGNSPTRRYLPMRTISQCPHPAP